MIVVDLIAYRFSFPPNYDAHVMQRMFGNTTTMPYSASQDQHGGDDESETTDEEEDMVNEQNCKAIPVPVTEAISIDEFLSAGAAAKSRRDRKKFSKDTVVA